MSPFINWSDIGPNGWTPRRLFLHLTPGIVHTVRLYHRPVKFWRYFDANRRRHFISDETARDLLAEHVAGVECRYTVNVLDRADGHVKVLEGSEKLFLEFRRCHELTGIELGGPDAFDIAVQVSVVEKSKVYHVSYESEKRTPFTSREKDSIRLERMDLAALFSVSETP